MNWDPALVGRFCVHPLIHLSVKFSDRFLNTSSQFETFLDIFNTNTVSAQEATATDAFTASLVIIRPMTFDEPLVSGVSEQGVTEETHIHTRMLNSLVWMGPCPVRTSSSCQSYHCSLLSTERQRETPLVSNLICFGYYLLKQNYSIFNTSLELRDGVCLTCKCGTGCILPRDASNAIFLADSDF